MDTVLYLISSHVFAILSFALSGLGHFDVQQQRGEWGVWGLGKVAVEVCMQMAVVVRACVQQYATHYQCGALCVLTSTHTVDCCTITIHALTASTCVDYT